MTLEDLQVCKCGHPRRSHVMEYVPDVTWVSRVIYTECDDCDCKGFAKKEGLGRLLAEDGESS